MGDADEAGADEIMKLKPTGMTVDRYVERYGQKSLDGFFSPYVISHQCEMKISMYSLIRDTVIELNKVYVPMTAMWVMDRKPKIREQVRELEDEISVAVMCEDVGSLKEKLREYYDVWLGAIMEFSIQKEKYIPF